MPEPEPEPPSPVSAEVAIRRAVEGFCAWFLDADRAYSLDGLRAAAFEAGYRRGTSVNFIPLPEMFREPSFSAMGFDAAIADRRSAGHGVAAFVSFHHPTCQIQVYGYGDVADDVLRTLESSGWRRDGAPLVHGPLSAQRYRGHGLTLVVNRPVQADAGDGPGLDVVLNLTPGEESQRGVFAEP